MHLLFHIYCAQPSEAVMIPSSSEMNGHGKLSGQHTSSVGKLSFAGPPKVGQCLSVSFCSMALCHVWSSWVKHPEEVRTAEVADT